MIAVPRPVSVVAVQWENTPASLAAIQRLLQPASPLFDGLFQLQASLAVMVTSQRPLIDQELAYIEVGGWVLVEIADSGVTFISVLKDAEFQARYVRSGVGEP
jgi:hypothetical protein